MKRKPLYALLYLVILFVLAAVAMLLWNAIVPKTLHLITINYCQTLGLLVLARILFGGFRFPGPGGGWGSDDRKQLLKDKLMSMSDQDKASFKEEWRRRCGDREKPAE